MPGVQKIFVLFTIGLLVILPAGLRGAGAQAQSEATFEQRLVFGLEARRPSELKFVQAVVATVERGELPQKLVDRFFFWSRERSARNGGRKARRPIIYFQPGLTIQAERLGIEIRS